MDLHRTFIPLSFFVAGAGWLLSLPSQPEPYWLIRSHGVFFYRYEKGQQIPLKGSYSPLRRTADVLCTSPPCELLYEASEFVEPQPLKLRIHPNRWTSLKSAHPSPPPPVEPATDVLKETTEKFARRGSSRGADCYGDALLIVPSCYEVVNPRNFAVEWVATSESSGFVGFSVQTMEADTVTFRADGIQMSRGRYGEADLVTFILGVQEDRRIKNIVLRFVQPDGRQATRILQVASRSDIATVDRQIKAITVRNPLYSAIARLSVYMTANMWSEAARQALTTLELAPEERLLQTYALLGVCMSGFQAEIDRLRQNLEQSGIRDVCPAINMSSNGRLR
jgi:hypothetical protein